MLSRGFTLPTEIAKGDKKREERPSPVPGLFSVGFGAVQSPLYDKLHPRRPGEELGGLERAVLRPHRLDHLADGVDHQLGLI